ncbi:MAG: hypothetical protein MUF54_20135, partial [Polyangiaceae bacterium]|nr:hypothetical protein [Polyangiaceae bacterium]
GYGCATSAQREQLLRNWSSISKTTSRRTGATTARSHVLIENEDRSRALHADVGENFCVTTGAKSLCGSSYAIVFSVACDGPVYRLPTDGGQRPATRWSGLELVNRGPEDDLC